MTLLTENSWPLIWICGALAAIFLVLLKVTQQGKFLIWTGTALLFAALFFLVDALWVTDSERIEAVVHAVADSARRSDVEAVLALLTDDVTLEQGPTQASAGGELARGPMARVAIRSTLQATHFDTMAVSNLRIDVGQLSRQGKADFRVFTTGTTDTSTGHFPFGTDASGSDWSFGLREMKPGEWRVSRITAVRLPGNVGLPQMTRGGP